MCYPESGLQAVGTFFPPWGESSSDSRDCQKGAQSSPPKRARPAGATGGFWAGEHCDWIFLFHRGLWQQCGGEAEVSEVSTAAGQARDKFPRENTGVGSARDLAANICMPAGCVILLFPALKERPPCQLKREGRGEWLHSSPIQYKGRAPSILIRSHTLRYASWWNTT